jgi:hypothetical protein
LVAQKQVRPDDLVWTAGMERWEPAGSVATLSMVPPTPQVAPQAPHLTGTAATPASAIGYYSPLSGLPARAVAALQGHAPPRGDRGDWPLDDARVAQFKEAFKLRKRVTAAAGLYRALLLLMVIADVIILIGGLGVALGGGSRNAGQALMGLVVGLGVLLGFTVLYWAAARSTRRSQRWAPLTMFILFLAGGCVNVFKMLVVTPAPNAQAASAIVGIVGLLFAIAFAVVSWRSFGAVPQYLAQPAWCQELLVTAEL